MKSVAFFLLSLLLFFAAPAFATFHDNGNGTVTDSETGLTWQKAADSTAKNWQEALAACASLTLGGQSDWRLPNRNELQSIVDYRYADPTVDSNFFPSTSGTFWTSTTVADSPSAAYTVDFSSGAVSYNDKASGSFQVRAVRGGATPVPPTSFFFSNGNGTVTDSRTGLVWRQVPLDADGNDAADALNWQEALAAATRLNFAGQNDWRLPNRNELQSIVDYRYADPAIDSNVFPKVTGGTFWTSTTVADSPSTAYTVDFNIGAVSYNDKASGKYSVLAVRSRASVSIGSFKFFQLPERVITNTPFWIEVVSDDAAFNGEVKLSIKEGGGVYPTSVKLVNGRWKGDISVTRPSEKTYLEAYYEPMNKPHLSGRSDWFKVERDAHDSADLQVNIVENRFVYSSEDHIYYDIYVQNLGYSLAGNTTIKISHSAGFANETTSWTCSGSDDTTCRKIATSSTGAEFDARIYPEKFVHIRVEGQGKAGLNEIQLTVQAQDAAVHDPIPENNNVVSLLRTKIPDLEGNQETRLISLPGSVDFSKSADADTVVLTHGLQPTPCYPTDLWTGSKSTLAQAGYLIQQAAQDKGLKLNIYQFFWQGACQRHFGLGYGIGPQMPTADAYKNARKNVYFAAQQLAKQLYQELGPNYNKKIHFIGHSLGTAVNAYAANLFLNKAANISQAQVTILDHPNHIGKIPFFIGNDDIDEKEFGFDDNFFANVLPFQRKNLSLHVDNYHSAYSSFNKLVSAGVGTQVNGRIFNRRLDDPHEIGYELLPDEGSNDHSGVHQWYRWTMLPKKGENFTGKTFVCAEDGKWNNLPSGINASLNPCPEQRGGWRESILVSDPAGFPAPDGGSAEATNSTVVETSGAYPYGCSAPSGNFVATVCTEVASSSFSKAGASTSASLEAEPQIPKSYIEFTVTVPKFLRYISFDYSFGNLGDGDYVYIFLDGVPVWKMGGDGLTAGETVSSGLIPVRAEAGQKKLIIALYGVGEQNAQFSLNNFKFTTVADTDGDGRPDDEDAFPNDPSEWLDTDKDGIGNNADLDDDNDGVADSKDAFPFDPSEWSDTDGDGQGDNADVDDDNDGVADISDNCPRAANPQQGDADGDSIGDACDTSQPSEGKWPLHAVLKLLLHR